MDNVVVRQLLEYDSEHDPVNAHRRGGCRIAAELVSGSLFRYDYAYNGSWSESSEEYDAGKVRLRIRRRRGKTAEVELLLPEAGAKVFWREGGQVSVLPAD